MFESRISAGATEKLPGWEKFDATTVAWSTDMQGHAKKCVERYCELANKKHSNYTKSQLLAWTTTVSRRRKWNQLKTCQKYHRLYFKCMYLTQTGRSDILWSVGCIQDTQILLETLKILNQLWTESNVSSEVEHVSTEFGCARSKRHCLTVPQNRKFFLLVLVCEWTDSLLLIYGMW